jgi:hypothetical protein
MKLGTSSRATHADEVGGAGQHSKRAEFLATAAKLANIVIIGLGILGVFALGYFVYYYSWSGQRQFTSWKGVLFNYVAPGLLATFSFAALRLRATYRINLALGLLSVGAALVASETILDVWYNLPSVVDELNRTALTDARIQAAKRIGVPFDMRSRQQVVNDLRAEGIDAVLSVFPQGLLAKQNDATVKSGISLDGAEVLPLAGISKKYAVVCNESGEYVGHGSDEHGFNNPPGVWNLPSIDIAAVGDSYVQVWCVPPEKHFLGLIRKSYPATLNLGMEGNGPLTMLATIKEYAQVVRPKVVLWVYCEGNDLADLYTEQRSALLMRYMERGFSQNLFGRQKEIDSALVHFIEKAHDQAVPASRRLSDVSALVRSPDKISRIARSISRFSQIRQNLGLVGGKENELIATTDAEDGPRDHSVKPIVGQFEKILLEAKGTVDGWGGRLYFVYLPMWHRYVPGQEKNPDRESVLEAVGRVGLPIVDVHQIFSAQKHPADLFPFGLQGHYTEEGNRILAEYVLQSISIP